MGFTSPLNQEITVWGRIGKIIGVTKDFHFASFRAAIEPLIFRIPNRSEQDLYYSTMTVRFASQNPDDVISFMKRTWEKHASDIPFQFYFFDEYLNAQYKSEHTMSSLFTYFSFLSILIACLGLFGLASLSAQQRTREIGIRKVLGASTSHAVMILSREFLVWVVISNLIAFPVAWYAMHIWLEGFAYRVEIGWWVFALAGGISLIIALLTVSTQAIKAALANPIEALRYE
jgi:putative ABC transport system permease protein